MKKSKKEIVLALIEHYDNGNKAQFSKRLGVTAQSISAWITRSSFDAELIFTKCEGVSGDFLLSGEGPILKKDRERLSPDKQLVDICRKLVDLFEQKDAAIAQLTAAIKSMEE